MPDLSNPHVAIAYGNLRDVLSQKARFIEDNQNPSVAELPAYDERIADFNEEIARLAEALTTALDR